jgi:hypothetical protein
MSAKETSSSIDLIGEKLYLILSKEYEQLVHFVKTLKEEQKCIMDRRTKDLTDLLSRIEQELASIHEVQKQREQILQKDLSSIPSEKNPGIAARILVLPEVIKKRCHEIARKVEVELLVIHEIGWQNQMLLSKAVHFLQEVLAPLIGVKRNETLSIYGQHGKLQTDSSRLAIFQGVG